MDRKPIFSEKEGIANEQCWFDTPQGPKWTDPPYINTVCRFVCVCVCGGGGGGGGKEAGSIKKIFQNVICWNVLPSRLSINMSNVVWKYAYRHLRIARPRSVRISTVLSAPLFSTSRYMIYWWMCQPIHNILVNVSIDKSGYQVNIFFISP